MNSLFLTLLIGGATGVLLGTAGAKIWAAARTRLAWPEGANFLRFHLSSNFVIAAEIIVSAIALAIPGHRIVSLLLAIIYAGFVVGATTLKGQECGCFGIEGMKVGPAHIWGCALTAAALLASAVSSEEIVSPRPLRLVVALASAVVMTVAMQLWNRLTRVEIDDTHHDQLFIVLSPTCTACAALKVMENHDVNDSELDGTILWVDRDSEQIAPLREAGVDVSAYPAVVSMNSADPSDAHVQSGLRECREVLQSWRTRQLALQA
ncbi:hypothetical protein [Actinomyces oris]|uniref:hypothetical protein n=1 Tax=Actinomyces oris TaxID=544580 RepID=UPI0028059289|nr:hypothetical protein [Actinomyces oris]MDR0179851.1 hypothetical protein [Actinomyces oris]